MNWMIPTSLIAALAVAGCASNPTVEAKAPVTTTEAVATDGTAAAEQEVFSHKNFDAVLAEYVNDFGMVDYKRLAANRAGLDGYVEELAGSSPKSAPALFPTKEHAMAYWINAYNALMIRAVLDAYPVDSVTDIKVAHGVFSRINFPVGGKRMSLDDIEKGVLLKEWDVPELHWALTCASLSCPRIDKSAFVAEGLMERLDREARLFLQSTRAVVIGETTVKVSKYFDWYGKDFGGDALAYINRYLSDEQRAALAKTNNPSVEFLSYDWRLNDQNKEWAAKQ